MVTRNSGIYLFAQSSEWTRKLQSVVLMRQLHDEHEVTLNDCILSGPALQPNLVSVVEKMFLQIKVDERDQDALRYLWRDLKSDDPPRIYR